MGGDRGVAPPTVVEGRQLADHRTGTDPHLGIGQVDVGLAVEEEEGLGAALTLRAQDRPAIEVEPRPADRQPTGGRSRGSPGLRGAGR